MKRSREEEDDEAQCAGATLIEIIEIYQIKCAHALARTPSCAALTRSLPTSLTSHAKRGAWWCASRCVRARRLAKRPRGTIAQSNPVPEAKRALEYLVYGRFTFKETDADGVERLGTEWVPVEQMPADPYWGEKEDKFDDLVREEREPFA